MDWQMVYDALCKVMSQSRVNSMIEIWVDVAWATTIILMIGIAVGVGGLFANLSNLIPSREKPLDTKERVSLWQTLKKWWGNNHVNFL